MNEKEFAKIIEKSLTNACYRNGYIEDLHSDRTKNISDTDMKKLNKDIYNRVYTVCLAFIERTYNIEKGNKILNQILGFNSLFGKDWDEPEIVRDMFIPENFKIMQEIEKELENEFI